MTFFSQKGKDLSAHDVETVYCKAWTSKKGKHHDARTLFRTKEKKQWVKIHTFTQGTANIRLAYEGRRAWKNRIFEVRFDFTSDHKLTEDEAIEIAKAQIEKDDYANFFDFYNKTTVIGFEEQEQKIGEDDLHAVRECEDSDDGIVLENTKVIDVKGWGEK